MIILSPNSSDMMVKPVLTTENVTAELLPSPINYDAGMIANEMVQPSPKRSTISEILKKVGEWKEPYRSDEWN